MEKTVSSPAKQPIKKEKNSLVSETVPRAITTTQETELERKLRLLKLQKESDLDHAADLLGISREQLAQDLPSTNISSSNNNTTGSVIVTNPDLETVADFEQYADDLIKQHINPYASHKYFPHLLENLIINLIKSRDIVEVRKVGGIIQDIISQKQKEKLALEKANAKNKKESAPSLVGGSKKHGKSIDIHDYGNDNDYDDFY